MAQTPGPSRFTFDTSTGALLTTGGGGGSSDVNITEVAGTTIAATTAGALPVELFDGTNPIGTEANPLNVEGAPSTTSSAPAQTAVSSTASVVLAANAARLEATIVNTGTTVVYIAVNGQVPTTTAYYIALSACSTANDGTGGIWISDVVKGQVQAICGTSGTICVTELTA
jgi:hypothetical protein